MHGKLGKTIDVTINVPKIGAGAQPLAVTIVHTALCAGTMKDAGTGSVTEAAGGSEMPGGRVESGAQCGKRLLQRRRGGEIEREGRAQAQHLPKPANFSQNAVRISVNFAKLC